VAALHAVKEGAFALGSPLNRLEKFERVATTALARCERFVARHPRGLTSALVIGMAGFAATAFGIAPLVGDPADLPQHLVSETVQPANIDTQLELLAEHELSLYRSDLTRRSDTADSLLRRLNADDAEFAQFLRRDPTARKLLDGRPGKMVQLRTGTQGRVEELIARYPAEAGQQFNTRFARLVISRTGGTLHARTESAALESQVRLGSGTVDSSLFAATDSAHIPDAIASQMVEMFSTEIDFHRELRKGDNFTVLYESLTADGEPITWANGGEMTGRVLAAEFVNKGHAHSAVWYVDPSAGGKGAYFGLDGQSKRHAFLGSPLAFSRVTSSFGMRMHPIMQTWRQHQGVDYGAPSGTPVRSVGDGVVDLAGWQNGYGNVVQVKHSNDRTTIYAHLSRIDVKKGQRIDQGTQLGAVGATGWATGPHLHFEFKVKGQQQNPLAMAQASEALVISPAAKAQFTRFAEQTRSQLQVAASMAGRTNFSE
jgi:murein DD-endopeptidase MepM/ murein hydrolase activator NlpD